MNRHGLTLIELLVVVTIVSTMTSLSALALAGAVGSRPTSRSCEEIVRTLVRRGAVAPISADQAGNRCPAALVLPDGQVISRGWDRLTGAPDATE